MTDNNTQNTTQQANTQPEENGTAGKMFTQEEVNSIVKDRLARERAKGQTSGTANDNDNAAGLDAEKAQLDADRQQLQNDRNTFECERYCKENGIDVKLIELIGSSDPEEFQKKTESLRSIFAQARSDNAVARYSTGAAHGSEMHGDANEPDGVQFFKPSGTY